MAVQQLCYSIMLRGVMGGVTPLGLSCWHASLVVLIFCHIWLVWTDYVYHRFAWRPYRTFPQSRYLAVLDPLTRLGSPSYSSSHSHGRATSLARLPLHQFWHAWVRSVAITKISSVAYSVPYQASVSLCSACWRIASAFCDSIFLWLGPSCIYSVCTRP